MHNATHWPRIKCVALRIVGHKMHYFSTSSRKMRGTCTKKLWPSAWYGILEFNVPLDTVQVTSETRPPAWQNCNDWHCSPAADLLYSSSFCSSSSFSFPQPSVHQSVRILWQGGKRSSADADKPTRCV